MSEHEIEYRLRAGHLERVGRGVYRYPGAPRTQHQDLMAACLSVGGIGSHRSAPALIGFQGLSTDIVEVSAPRRRCVPDGTILHIVRDLEPIDVTRKDGIPITTVIRTLVDLGAVVDREQVEIALDHALRKRMTYTDQLRRHLERLGGNGRRGAGVLRKVIADRIEFPTESIAERRFLALVKRSRVPLPEAQFVILVEDRGYRLDFVWRSRLLVVEVEGYDSHSGWLAWEHDLARRNELTRRGWRVLHITWWELNRRPEHVIALLAEVLAA